MGGGLGMEHWTIYFFWVAVKVVMPFSFLMIK